MISSIMDETKTCTRCQTTYPLNTLFFYKRKTKNKESWYPLCKECRTKESREKTLPTRKVDASKLLKENYHVSARCKNQPYTQAVIDALRQDPHQSNHLIAIITGSPYSYVSNIRTKMETNGEIPFVTETYNAKGDWRRRCIHKKRAEDVYGRQPLVYFIQPNDDPHAPIKIGYSDRFTHRLANLQSCCPYQLKVLLTVPGVSR